MERQGDNHVVYSSFTAAAQYGLHLSVTHKPFRAATASPELQSWSLRLRLSSSSALFALSSSSRFLILITHIQIQTYYLSFIYLQTLSCLSTSKAGKVALHLKHTGKRRDYYLESCQNVTVRYLCGHQNLALIWYKKI